MTAPSTTGRKPVHHEPPPRPLADRPVLRVALLGADDTTASIARAVLASRRFQLAGVCELSTAVDPRAAVEVDALAGKLRPFDAWETLLTGQHADVVVVARAADEDYRAEQLRKLAQTSIPVLASHPVVDSMLLYYELDMIRRDTSSMLVPGLAWRRHPAVRKLAEYASQDDASPLGRIEQVVVQRRLAPADKHSVAVQFARDVDLIRAIAGDMTRLGAMAGLKDDVDYAGLGVQMWGPRAIAARWSVDPLHTDTPAQLTVVGTRGKAVVRMGDEEQPWTTELVVDGVAETETHEPWSHGAAALTQLDAALSGAEPQCDWVDAARAVELAETIELSLKKARTIELHYEDYTEESTFKGLMASLGCGLLIFGVVLMGLVAIGDLVGVPYIGAWPYVLAGGLGLFLALQLLMLVFRPAAHSTKRESGPGPSS